MSESSKRPGNPPEAARDERSGEPESASRRRFVRRASAFAPVVITLASGAALAQASVARRAVKFTNPNSDLRTCAAGFNDNDTPGDTNDDTAWGFMPDPVEQDSICVDDTSSPGTATAHPIDTTNWDDQLFMVTESSWASLGPTGGGRCSGM
jgi:hypothetical protein